MQRVILQHLSALFLGIAVAACGGGGTSNSASAPPAAAPVVPTPVVKGKIDKDLSLTSTLTGAVYPIQVYVPADYAATTDTLPVIYALDGEGIADTGVPRFPMMAEILEKDGIRAVLVGIGNYRRRGIDYLMPGATDFYNFMTTELIPAVETRYRTDSARRTLDGHSFGGLFVVLALTMDRPGRRFFANFVSQDPSLWNQAGVTDAQEQKMFDASSGKLPGTMLILSSSASNDSFVEPWYQKLKARGYEGLSLWRLPKYEQSHDDMFAPSFSDSLKLILGKVSG